MVLESMIKSIRLIIFAVIMLLFSCEERGWIVKCPDCTEDEPSEATLKIKLNPGSDPVLVRIYEGELGDNILIASFEAYDNEDFRTVSLNKMYTLTATYTTGGTLYIAVDSVIPGVKYDKSQCDEPCYYVYDKIVDLRLKYTE